MAARPARVSDLRPLAGHVARRGRRARRAAHAARPDRPARARARRGVRRRLPAQGIDVRVAGAARPADARLGELERVRDDLAERLRDGRAERSPSAPRRGGRTARLLERMLLDPGRYKFVRGRRNADIGEPRLRRLARPPAAGLIGMLMGWWQVKLSSGCPLATGSGRRVAALPRARGPRSRKRALRTPSAAARRARRARAGPRRAAPPAAAASARRRPGRRSRWPSSCILLALVLLGVAGFFAGGTAAGVLLGCGARARLAGRRSSWRCASTSPATARTRRCWPAVRGGACGGRAVLSPLTAPRRSLSRRSPSAVAARVLRRCGVPFMRRSGGARASGPDRTQAPAAHALTGLHHVTLICRDLERTTAFYRDLLGPRARRTTAPTTTTPDARHFWFGDADGAARARCVSFLEYPRARRGRVGRRLDPPLRVRGRVGRGARRRGATTCARHGVESTDVFDRGGFRSIYLRDPDGHILEIATRGA